MTRTMSTPQHSPLPSPRYRFAAPLAGVWAGVVIGGSLVAAPARFQAPSFTPDVALEVRRAQFAWLGVTEVILCVALLVTAFGSAGSVGPSALRSSSVCSGSP